MRFTYTISHDLKSPLVTISVFLNYLEQDLQQADPAAVAKDLAYIRNAAGRMSKLLDELLALSRVGHVESPAVDVPLQTVVQEALALVAGQIAARGVQVDVTAVPIFLHGDRSRFVEVFQNLLDNACKFMGAQPSPRIEIAVEETAGEQVIVVRDNGNGIDPRFLSKIFGLFEKLDPESGGTGIGLALVRRIVEVHGGRIWVESEGLGQGATFRFTLAKTHLRP
jgi:signal transduction histidine kinase